MGIREAFTTFLAILYAFFLEAIIPDREVEEDE